MNIPQSDLQEFLKDYASLFLPEQQVLRGDFFRSRNDDTKLTALIVEAEGKQLLVDSLGHILCRYDRITPMFIPPTGKVSPQIEDLLEQLAGLRSRVTQENYNRARDALQALCQPSQPPVPAYLVFENALSGVVTPAGKVIVPTQYAQIRPFAFTDPIENSVFLCRRSEHHLNSMDVYDWNGNCIFSQLGNVIVREEAVSTLAISGAPVRKVKSLWVVRQAIDHPFPEDPDFQLVQDIPKWYSLKKLRSTGSDDLPDTAMEDRPVWSYTPTPTPDALLPLVTAVSERIGCSVEKVLSRLPDYHVFRWERMPLSIRLASVTPRTPLGHLGLSTRAYHCLIRSKLQTVGDLMTLSGQAIAHLSRGNDEIIKEITMLYDALQKPNCQNCNQ